MAAHWVVEWFSFRDAYRCSVSRKRAVVDTEPDPRVLQVRLNNTCAGFVRTLLLTTLTLVQDLGAFLFVVSSSHGAVFDFLEGTRTWSQVR